MICAWLYKGKRISGCHRKIYWFWRNSGKNTGRQVLIEDGDKIYITKYPCGHQSQNTSTEKRVLMVNGNNLEGKVTQTWKGESKEWLLSQLHEIKEKNRKTP